MTAGTTAILLATLLAGISLVAFGLIRARRRAAPVEAEPSLPVGEAPALAEATAELVARMEGLLAEQTRRQGDALAGLRADILHLKSDVEWLAGERMIEQAIALAQSGVEPDEIGRELGLTRETAETIAAFRKH